ncbi:SRPBCC family protein [Paraglaciecola arctica]|uniref:SRPBCC family protein n=1 Tax=Paraglaciecola arctica TaxID=1128911 RepID=UPI00129BFCE3
MLEVFCRDADKNGLGSVRLIKSFPTPAFEEIIKAYEPNKFIAYEISKGSPIKNHNGELHFSGDGETSKLVYTISFEPKVNIPMWGKLLSSLIEKPIRNGLKRYAEQL